MDAGKCEAKHHRDMSYNENCNWDHGDRDYHPMNCVDLYGAQQFCSWAGGRLPTEQEWEAEASNNGSRVYPWGDQEVNCDLSIWGDGSNTDGCGKDSTWPVCSKRDGDSVSRLCDMAGNVWEWTSSRWGSKKKFSVMRGGSWVNGAPDRFSASYRYWFDPDWSGSVAYGFRCVR